MVNAPRNVRPVNVDTYIHTCPLLPWHVIISQVWAQGPAYPMQQCIKATAHPHPQPLQPAHRFPSTLVMSMLPASLPSTAMATAACVSGAWAEGSAAASVCGAWAEGSAAASVCGAWAKGSVAASVSAAWAEGSVAASVSAACCVSGRSATARGAASSTCGNRGNHTSAGSSAWPRACSASVKGAGSGAGEPEAWCWKRKNTNTCFRTPLATPLPQACLERLLLSPPLQKRRSHFLQSCYWTRLHLCPHPNLLAVHVKQVSPSLSTDLPMHTHVDATDR
jgi:hypothetical protein